MVDVLNAVNYQDPDQSLIRAKKLHDSVWRARVRRRIYERVSWNDAWKDEPARKDPDRPGVPCRTLDQVFQKKVQKSVIGKFLDDAVIPASRDVRAAMFEILEYDWRSYTQKQWKQFEAKNDFIDSPVESLKRAIEKNEAINRQWLEGIVTTLRLVASGMTKVDPTLKRFKRLVHLSLGGNEIEELEGRHLPRDLRVLQLAGNRISSLNRLVNRAPKRLIFLGLSQNCISNEHVLHSVSNSLHCLKVLDLEDNDLRNLTDVLGALKLIKSLRALILEGNPCSTCLGYKNVLLTTFPNLIYLDNVIVKPFAKRHMENACHPDKLSTGALFMHVYRIIRLAKPPPLKKEKWWYCFEVDLPLLDAHPFQQEQMEEIQEEFNEKGTEFPVHDIDKIAETTASRSQNFEWKELLLFNQPLLEVPPPDDDLKLLSDTFKSVVTIRLVRQKFPEDYKRKSQGEVNMEVKERTEICKFTCALKNMSWAERSQDFSWTLNETEDNSAKPWPPNTLPQQKFTLGDPNKGKKSTKTGQKQEPLLEKVPAPGEPIPLPQIFTIHIGFGLRRFPDFNSIEIPVPTK